MTFPKLSGFIHFSKTFPGLENAVLKFHDFSRFFMTVRTLLNVKYDTFSFNLYLSTVFLTFKYSTVFISLLGTIYFNLIITFFIYVEVSTVQCSCSNCVFTIF